MPTLHPASREELDNCQIVHITFCESKLPSMHELGARSSVKHHATSYTFHKEQDTSRATGIFITSCTDVSTSVSFEPANPPATG